MKNCNDEKYKDGKKKIKSDFFLFTPDGNKAVLEYMRNLTPQVLVGGVWIVFVLRSNTLEDYMLWGVSIAMAFIFFYIVIANITNFIQQITDHMAKQVENLSEYKVCDNPYNFKVWCKFLLRTLVLVAKNKKSLLVEFILAIIFLLIPTVIVVFASVNSAIQLHKSMIGG
ncbi:hypothetical protein M5F66_01855 [Acinetobacter sp. ANC 5033]|uniref:hypothetical protein n=1 Tax=Acinetobacter amyesii TaxID=2942470 RepID=UPI00201B911F|nr:hypothetical protein [Acinetobacter amyesii]MCL6237099.1 hypothetical protein [Acinetobacter amyesii]